MDGVFDPGSILVGKYRVEDVLGHGGMGIVLKVTHLQLGEELAIKVLLPEAAINLEVTGRFCARRGRRFACAESTWRGSSMLGYCLRALPSW
jgi:serine/threonine protein kinase